MNFNGPFDSELTHDSPVSLGGERFAFDSKPGFTQHHASDSHVIVPDAHLLFSGEYTRIGSDLIISGGGEKFVVGNYFKGETRPILVSKDGATLSGHIVDALTGHIHYAQATGTPAAGEVIGHVLKLSGSASVIRNGVSVELHIGDAVQKGDVVQTGSDSTIGLTFVDGSAFGMTSNARMVLNEMIYDPNGSSNSSLISLVQGTITFVAGQTAKNGNMRVETPVATMGIRGTAVLVEIGANDGPTKFSVLVEPDGHTGSYNLYDKTTGQLIGTVSQAGQVTFVSVSGIGQPPTALEQLKTLADQQAEKALIQQVFQLYFPNYNPDDSNPKLPKFGSNTSGNNLAEILIGTASNGQHTVLTQIELRFAVTDPNTGITTYQNRIFYNTKAQFSASSILSEQAFVSSVESFKISDLVHIDDPDIGNAPFYDVATPFVAGSAIIKSAVSTNPNLSAGFLSQFLHIDQTTGVITFDRLGFNFLGDGESVTFMIQVTSRSGPDVANVIIPITITGDNDVPNDNGVPNGAPTIVLSLSDIVGAVKEDTLVTPDVAIVKNGTITFRDVDLSDGHQAGVVFTSSTSTLPGFVPGEHLGSFTLGPVVEDKTDIVNTGTLGWHFTLDDNDPVLQSLAEGQTITQVYTVTVVDDHGASVDQTITITITGTNDAPVLAFDTSDGTINGTPFVHQAVEVADTTGAPDTIVDVASGTLTFVDLDLSDTHQASAILHSGSVVWSGGDYIDIPQETRDALDAAMTAVVSEDNTDPDNQGSVGWEFKLPDHLFDFLAHGETLTLIYDVTVQDDNGVSSTQQVTVQIGAANDQPVITVIDNCAAVQEDVDPVGGFLKDTGEVAVTFTDTDLTDSHTAHVSYNDDAAGSAGVSQDLAAALATALTVQPSALAAGAHSFNWNFALDNSLVQYLAEGETIRATYTITVEDSSNGTNDTSLAQVVTVTITGTNDAPTITTINPAADAEGNTGAPDVVSITVADQVSISDVDASDVHVPYVTATLAFDSSTGPAPSSGILADLFTLNATDGTVSYDRAAFDYLAGGEQITATFTFDASSGPDTLQKSITITIDGVNDTPVITVTDPVAVAEGNTGTTDTQIVTVADHVSITDVDASDTHVPYVTDTLVFDSSTGPAPSSGILANLFMLNEVDGTISYDRAAFDYLAEGEHVTATFTFDASSGPDTLTKSITVTIDGVNDAPTIVADAPVHLVEATSSDAGTPVSVAALTIADVDGTANYDATELLANGWIYNSIDDTYSKDGVYGTATLDAAHNLTYALDNNLADSLTSSDHPVETFCVSVIDDHGLTAFTDVSFIVDGSDDAPVLNGDNVSVSEIGDGSPALPYGTTKVFDIALSDPDQAGSLTVSAAAGDGVVSGVSDGTVASINSSFSNGITYTPNNTVANANDMVTLTVTDSHGLSDTLHFVFQQNGNGGATLTGTTGKDLIFSTGGNDTMTGLAGHDNFVFSPSSGQDTITDFTSGTDKIDLQALTSFDTAALNDLLNTADHVGVGNADMLLHLNGNTDTLLLKGVATLSTSDFILHA